jgi:hypothetical protein
MPTRARGRFCIVRFNVDIHKTRDPAFVVDCRRRGGLPRLPPGSQLAFSKFPNVRDSPTRRAAGGIKRRIATSSTTRITIPSNAITAQTYHKATGHPRVQRPLRTSGKGSKTKPLKRNHCQAGLSQCWRMIEALSAVLFKEDPKYNGPHICPRCGSQSLWRATQAEDRMISVECEGNCGEYNMSFSQLSDYPGFKEGQILG